MFGGWVGIHLATRWHLNARRVPVLHQGLNDEFGYGIASAVVKTKEEEETLERYLLMGKDNMGEEAWDDIDGYLDLHAGQGS
jgi:hypothetical protein